MKKYISLSSSVIALSYSIKEQQNTAAEGETPKIEDVTISKEVCMSKGTVAELPEDHPLVKDLVAKKHLAEYVEPVETPAAPANTSAPADSAAPETKPTKEPKAPK